MTAIARETGPGPLVINGFNIVAERRVFVAINRKTGAEAKRDDNLFVLWQWCASQTEDIS